MSCRWQSPPSSHTGQSCGWFSITHSTTDARNLTAAGAVIDRRALFAAAVMHAITTRPVVSFSSRYCTTAHCRHAPIEPIAGCQQKYGRSRPTERQACSKFSLSSASKLVPSTLMIAILAPRQLALSARRSRADGSQRTTALPDVCFELVAKILDRARERLDRPGRVQTEGIAGRADELRVVHDHVEIARLTAPLFEVGQQILEPRQTFAARRAESARFLRKEVLQIARQIDDAHRVVDHRHRAGTHPATRGLYRAVLHRQVEMLLDQEIRRRTARQQAFESITVAHPAGVHLEDFADRRAHRQLPQPRALHAA